MSDATIQAIEDALQAHLADIHPDDGEAVVNWVAVMAYTNIESIDTDHRHGYNLIQPTSASYHDVTGLVHIGGLMIHETWMRIDDND